MSGHAGRHLSHARRAQLFCLRRRVDKFDELDHRLVGLVVDGYERQLLAFVDLVEGGLVLGRHLEQRPS